MNDPTIDTAVSLLVSEIKPLQENCLKVVEECVTGVHIENALKSLNDDRRRFLMELLPLNLSLNTTLPFVTDEVYWKRKCIADNWNYVHYWINDCSWRDAFVCHYVENMVDDFLSKKRTFEETTRDLEVFALHLRRVKINGYKGNVVEDSKKVSGNVREENREASRHEDESKEASRKDVKENAASSGRDGDESTVAAEKNVEENKEVSGKDIEVSKEAPERYVEESKEAPGEDMKESKEATGNDVKENKEVSGKDVKENKEVSGKDVKENKEESQRYVEESKEDSGKDGKESKETSGKGMEENMKASRKDVEESKEMTGKETEDDREVSEDIVEDNKETTRNVGKGKIAASGNANEDNKEARKVVKVNKAVVPFEENIGKLLALFPRLEEVYLNIAPAEYAVKNESEGDVKGKELINDIFSLKHLTKLTVIGFSLKESQISILAQNVLDSMVSHLNLSCNLLDDGCCGVLARVLESSRLRTLVLSNNCVGNAGVEALLSGLRGNDALLCLDLSKNYVGDGGGVGLAEMLRGDGFTSSLHKLDLSFNKLGYESGVAFGRVVRMNTGLLCLNLTGNALGKEVGKIFAESIAVNKNIRYFGIEFCGFDEREEDIIYSRIHRNRNGKESGIFL